MHRQCSAPVHFWAVLSVSVDLLCHSIHCSGSQHSLNISREGLILILAQGRVSWSIPVEKSFGKSLILVKDGFVLFNAKTAQCAGADSSKSNNITPGHCSRAKNTTVIFKNQNWYFRNKHPVKKIQFYFPQMTDPYVLLFIGSLLSPRLLVSNWSTIEKTRQQ